HGIIQENTSSRLETVLKLDDVVHLIQNEQTQPLPDLWQGYDFSKIPFAVYDPENVVYINHPNPPQERPKTLMAATSVDINGVQTATIPLEFCPDPATALPIAYHEGFHVFQHHNFAPIMPDMFNAMA